MALFYEKHACINGLVFCILSWYSNSVYIRMHVCVHVHMCVCVTIIRLSRYITAQWILFIVVVLLCEYCLKRNSNAAIYDLNKITAYLK